MQAFNHSMKYNCNLFVSNFIDHNFMQSDNDIVSRIRS